MRKKRVIIRENIDDMPSFLKRVEDEITYIDEPIEEFIRRNGLISLEEAWERLDAKENDAAIRHGRQ